MINEKSFKGWSGGPWKHLLGLLLMFFLSNSIASSQDQVIVSSKAGECNFSLESSEKWHTLRLRAHHPEYKGCHIDEDSMLSILSAAFLKNEPQRSKGVILRCLLAG